MDGCEVGFNVGDVVGAGGGVGGSVGASDIGADVMGALETGGEVICLNGASVTTGAGCGWVGGDVDVVGRGAFMFEGAAVSAT